MIYKVTKQFSAGGGKEQPCRQFKKPEEAKAFATENAEADAGMKIQTIYRVYEFDDLLETIDSNSIKPASNTAESAGGSQGQQSGATFKPSPLQMSPRPPGMPAKHWTDPEEDKKKDK